MVIRETLLKISGFDLFSNSILKKDGSPKAGTSSSAIWVDRKIAQNLSGSKTQVRETRQDWRLSWSEDGKEVPINVLDLTLKILSNHSAQIWPTSRGFENVSTFWIHLDTNGDYTEIFCKQGTEYSPTVTHWSKKQKGTRASFVLPDLEMHPSKAKERPPEACPRGRAPDATRDFIFSCHTCSDSWFRGILGGFWSVCWEWQDEAKVTTLNF